MVKRVMRKETLVPFAQAKPRVQLPLRLVHEMNFPKMIGLIFGFQMALKTRLGVIEDVLIMTAYFRVGPHIENAFSFQRSAYADFQI